MQPLFLQQLSAFDFLDILKDLLTQFTAVIPSFLGALTVFLLGWLIAGSLAKLVKRLVAAAGIDKAADRLNSIELVEKSGLRIVPSLVLSKVLYYFLMIIFIMAATDLLGMAALSSLMSDIINYIPSILTACVVFLLGIVMADFVKGAVLAAGKTVGIPSAGLIANFVFYFLLLAVAMSALTQAGINIEFISQNLTVVIGGIVLAFAIGYGLASRQTMANFLASFYSKNKVQKGDIIRIGEAEGMVIDMDSISITLRSGKHKIIVPMSRLNSENIVILNPTDLESTQIEELH
jgi:hypothetical protein